MARDVFEGLVYDEDGRPVESGYVGSEPVYIVEDGSFRYHLDARAVDAQVWSVLKEQIQQYEDLIADQAMRLLGRDDLFTRAAIVNAIRNFDQNWQQLTEAGLPQPMRQYLGLLGFSIVVNRHGEVLKVHFPSAVDDHSS